jgi:hypothetical protein
LILNRIIVTTYAVTKDVDVDVTAPVNLPVTFYWFSLFLFYGTIIARYSELSAVAFTDAILSISAVQFP